MLTRQGWTVALGSMGLVAAGRLFGIFELFLLGAGGAALVVAATVAVARTRLRVDIARELHPPRVQAGGQSKVQLELANRGRRRSPLLTLRDPVGEGRSASVVVAPLPPGATVRASYRLPTDRRGILHVGPLTVEVSDPFGLAAASTPAAPVTDLTVWPAIDDVPPLPHTTGDDPHGGADHPNALSAGGDDFYALRQYVIGDDLRRVHWRSTARRDELMVRQDEMPWQGRATVLLDTRRAGYTTEGFERAVSAAASVVVACARHRFLIRLLTTAGVDTGFGAGGQHVENILERLATVEPVDAGRMAAVVESLRRSGGNGALALFLGGRHRADIEAVAPLRRRFAHATVVAFDLPPGAARPAALVVDEEHPFRDVWTTAMRRRSRVMAR